MKADRLISILMLLQIHKQLTASELSERLEVSTRTIYRDIDSLSALGIPIFASKGTNGGIKLLGDYKTTLNGMSKSEIQSLFVPTSDKILKDLGIEKLKDNTILKLLGDSSKNQVDEIKSLQNYIYIDMNAWNSPPVETDKEILSSLQDSIWSRTSLKIVYLKPSETKEVILNPLGLVCKKGIWYLVAENMNIIKTYRVTSIKEASSTNTLFKRPDNFNLENYWKLTTESFQSAIPKYKFTFKANPSILNHIKNRQFINITSSVVKEGDVYLDIIFNDIFQGIEFAFGYGGNIEILSPKEAIEELKKKSLEIISLYKR